RSWSILSEDPYEEAAQQLFEQVSHPPEYVPRDHVPIFVPEVEHPEDLVPAEGEVGESSAAAARRQEPAMAHGVDCRYMETRLQDTERRMMAALELVNRRDPYEEAAQQLFEQAPHPLELRYKERRMMAALELVNHRVSYQVDVCTRESLEFYTRNHNAQKDRAAVRAEIEVLRNERLTYEQEGIQTREALTRSEAHCRALEARVAVLETHARRLEWQRQAADDFAVEHIMRTQALEARARDDPLENAGGSF
nr:hypothetical protein [Tanacetum cinerariifolium]